ncbi:ATP synthase F0, C subunit, partial [Vibrio harveyi]
NSN